MVRPSDYPPPFHVADFVGEPTDGPDDRIEVGILIVGGGPAGLACAIRLGQLLEEHPDIAEQLGEVPVAVLEKGKQAGSHLLSGAVVNQRSLKQLFGTEFSIADFPNYGEVAHESVYVLTHGRSVRIPTPPNMHNKGNVIVSLSQLARWLGDKAENAGAMILTKTTAQRLLVSDGAVVGVRTGDTGRAKSGEKQRSFEPGNDIIAKYTVLAEGTQGHLTGVALDHFGLHGADPQVWELAVKEVWKVAKPLDRVIHTMGWPLRPQAKYHEFGGSFIYPMGADMLSIGMVIGLDYTDTQISAHDLLQELKTHPMIRSLLEGGERLEWGAKTIPGGGFNSLPRKLEAPGLLLCGDGPGMVNVPTLKGVHYAIESGRLAAEAMVAALRGEGSSASPPLTSYDGAVRSSFICEDLHKVRDVRQVFGRGLFVGAAFAGAMIATKGKVSLGKLRTKPDATHELLTSGRAASYPVADGKLVFDKLSSVYASGNQTSEDQPDHISVQRRVPHDIAEMLVHLCPASVYSMGERGADGLVAVDVEPSNCVQCGAISAKGGRLTPPDGGSGPEYRLA